MDEINHSKLQIGNVAKMMIIEFPIKNSRGDRYSSVREVKAVVSRMELEQKKRSQLLESTGALIARASEVGEDPKDFILLVQTNFNNAKFILAHLQSFLDQPFAKESESFEKSRASKISFNEISTVIEDEAEVLSTLNIVDGLEYCPEESIAKKTQSMDM